MPDAPNPPRGFEPLFRTSPFLETIGPLFYRKEPDGGFVIGLRVLPKHANARGGAHGGLMTTLLDIALGYRASLSVDPPANLTTASLTADFAGRRESRRLDRGARGRAEGRRAACFRERVPDGQWRAVVRGSACRAQRGEGQPDARTSRAGMAAVPQTPEDSPPIGCRRRIRL